jgi:hypothetical protein
LWLSWALTLGSYGFGIEFACSYFGFGWLVLVFLLWLALASFEFALRLIAFTSFLIDFCFSFEFHWPFLR